MVDPYTIFQTAEAAISLAKFVGELISKVEHAFEFRESALARLKRAEFLCRDAGELLKTYGDRFGQFDTAATSLNFDIDETLRTTNKTIGDLSTDLRPLEKSFRDRLKVVAKQNRLEYNLNLLETHCSIIRQRIASLNLRATLSQATGIRHEVVEGVREELLQFRKELELQYKRRSALEDTLCRIADAEAEVDAEQDDADAAAAADENEPQPVPVHDERQNLERTLNLLDSSLVEEETIYGKLASDSGVEVQQEAIFIPYDIEPTPAPFERLHKFLTRHNAEARICMNQERWRRAEIHLGKALSYYKKCREQERMNLYELVSLTNDLALTQQKQHKWIESITESRHLLDLISTSESEESDLESSEDVILSCKALCLTTLADTLYEKHQLNKKDAEDLEQAKGLAEEAQNTFDRLRDSTKADDDDDNAHSHKRCLELLICIYNALGETTEADGTREELKDLFPVVSSPSASTAERLRSLSTSSPPSTPQDISHMPNMASDTHTQLTQAISTGNENALQPFLPFRDSIDLEKPYTNGKTPLMHAISAPNNQVSLVNQLLGPPWRAHPDGRGTDDTTSLHLAADLDMPHIVDILIQQGANTELTSNNETPLMLATSLCRDDVVRTLLVHGANIDVQWKDTWSLLHRSVKNCSTATTTALLSKDPGQLLAQKKDRYGKTALHTCADSVNLAQANAILSHPNGVVALNLEDHAHQTALCRIMQKYHNPQRLRFARLLYDFDKTALKRCEKAKFYGRYSRYLVNERRSSTTTVATTGTTGSSSSDGKQQPSKKKAKLWPFS